MYALSSGLFRYLARRRAVRFIATQTPPQSVADDLCYFELEGVGGVFETDSTRFHVTLTANLITEEKKKGLIHWENINDKLVENGIKNPATKVFQACLRLEELSTGLSYYNHLLDSGQSLSVMDLLFFSKLLLKNKKNIRKYEPLLLRLYEDLREHFLSSALIRKFAINVFLEIPSCFDDIIFILRNTEEKVGYTTVVEKAFQFNRPDVAFEFINNESFLPNDMFLKRFGKFCVNKAKEGVFVPDLITRLVNVFEFQTICFNFCNVMENLKILVFELNKHQKEFIWSVKKCVVNESTVVCSNCQKALLPKLPTKEEIQMLQSHFYETIFIKKDIYLTSHVAELRNFVKFLKKTQPFDIVMDVLNLIYRKKNTGAQVAYQTLNYFITRNMSVLLISREHSKYLVQKVLKSIEPKLRHKIQMFFTSNISEDDIFTLQAALHGGLGTGILTCDNLSNHLSNLDSNMKKIFLKWQMTHQYILSDKYMIEPPFSHSGVPQLTYCVENEKYIWHLPHQPEKIGRLSRICPIEWLCLEATKRVKS